MTKNPTPAPPETNWYYEKEGQPVGPVSFEQILDLAYHGILTPETRIKSRQSQHWELARILPVQWPGEAGSEEEYLLNQCNWYVQSEESVQGPRTLRDLGKAFLRGQLKPADKLRYGLDGEWQLHTNLGEMLIHGANFVPTPKRSTEPLTTRHDDSQSRVISHVSASPFDGLIDFIEGLSIVLGNAGGRVFRLLRRYWIPLAVLIGWLVINGITLMWTPAPGIREIHNHLQLAIAATDEVLANQPTPAVWKEFTARQMKEIERVREQLLKSSSSNTPSKQHLLWVIRDLLIPLWELQTPPKSIPDRASLRLHMEQALVMLKFEPSSK